MILLLICFVSLLFVSFAWFRFWLISFRILKFLFRFEAKLGGQFRYFAKNSFAMFRFSFASKRNLGTQPNFGLGSGRGLRSGQPIAQKSVFGAKKSYLQLLLVIHRYNKILKHAVYLSLEIWVFKTIFLFLKCTFLVFAEKLKKMISLCFGSDSALKTTDTLMFFWMVYMKMH